MENSSVVNSIVKIDPSAKMTTVHLKALEKQLAVMVY